MSTPAIPTKTALGHEELRHRVHRLSQRHRTVLLLVDGVRSLAEVLGMAQKAGASTQHFEELLRLGLVELPAPLAPPHPSVVDEPAGVLRSVNVSVPAPQAAPAPEAATPQPQGPLARALAEAAQSVPEASPVREPPAPQAPAPTRRHVAAPAARPSRRGAAAPNPPLTLDMPLELPVLTAIEEAPDGGSTPSETALHEQVLALLRTVVEREPPPFTSRVPARLARCDSLRELADLVLEIERYLVRSRRDRKLHEVMPLLREARELLGLGNTRVVGAGGEELG